MPLPILIGLVFIGIGSLVSFVLYLLIPRRTILEERLQGLSPRAGDISVIERPPTPLEKFLGRIGAGVPLRPEDMGKYGRMLIAAGLKKKHLPVFMGSKIGLAAALPLIYLLLYGYPAEKDATIRIVFCLVFGIIGFLVPSYWLTSRVKKRQLRIFHDLPDVLDIMTVSVEAGLSMDASMLKICEDPYFQQSPLVAEMKVALQETRAGKPRSEALRDMGERTMEDDLKAFSAMLIQTERLGTSLAQALRTHSDSLRTMRRQKAEEAAAKIPVKLLFPLVFFIFPALLFVILGPGIIRIMRMLAEI